MKYAVVYEPTATGRTREEVKLQIAEAIAFHIEGLRQAGEPVPPPGSLADTVRGPEE